MGESQKKLWNIKKFFSGKRDAGQEIQAAVHDIAEILIEFDKRLRRLEDIVERAPRQLDGVPESIMHRKGKKPSGEYGIVARMADGTPVMGYIAAPAEKPRKSKPTHVGGLPYKDD